LIGRVCNACWIHPSDTSVARFERFSIGKLNDRNPIALGLTVERLGFRVVGEKPLPNCSTLTIACERYGSEPAKRHAMGMRIEV